VCVCVVYIVYDSFLGYLMVLLWILFVREHQVSCTYLDDGR
jgi:hypothetical protein